METIPVSVIVMTKNEEPNISKCLKSLSAFAEIFVVDSMSTDRTVEIAEALGAKVYQFQWNGKYPKKKQWCLSNLPFSYDWVLFLDADEQVTDKLAAEILHVIHSNPLAAGFFVSYDYVFLGKVLHHGYKVSKLVLLLHKKAHYPEVKDELATKNMWEVEGHYQPIVEGPIAYLKNTMVHHDHTSLYEYFAKLNRYTDMEALLRSNGGYIVDKEASIKGKTLKKKLFDKMPVRSLFFFIFSYILKRGFLDGLAGLNYSLSLAFYYWQIDVKIVEMKLNKSF